MYKALTYVNLPPNNRKAPGDEISQEEFDACDPPQTEDDIQAMLDAGSISEDMDAEILPEHRTVTVAASPEGTSVLAGDKGAGGDKE